MIYRMWRDLKLSRAPQTLKPAPPFNKIKPDLTVTRYIFLSSHALTFSGSAIHSFYKMNFFQVSLWLHNFLNLVCKRLGFGFNLFSWSVFEIYHIKRHYSAAAEVIGDTTLGALLQSQTEEGSRFRTLSMHFSLQMLPGSTGILQHLIFLSQDSSICCFSSSKE